MSQYLNFRRNVPRQGWSYFSKSQLFQTFMKQDISKPINTNQKAPIKVNQTDQKLSKFYQSEYIKHLRMSEQKKRELWIYNLSKYVFDRKKSLSMTILVRNLVKSQHVTCTGVHFSFQNWQGNGRFVKVGKFQNQFFLPLIVQKKRTLKFS